MTIPLTNHDGTLNPQHPAVIQAVVTITAEMARQAARSLAATQPPASVTTTIEVNGRELARYLKP